MEQVVSFPGLGIGEITLNRVAFTIGGMNIYWYGIIFAAAFLAAICYILWRVRDFGLDSDRALDVIIGAVIGGIIGARLYYVIFSWEMYADNWLKIFDIREGGIAIYGGVIGGFLVGILMCRWRRVKLLPMADVAMTGLILAQAIGRWGNFINVEAFGSNTAMPWGMASPSITAYLTNHQAALAAVGVTVDPSMPVHPTFFYESVWCLIGFLILALYTKHRRFDGELVLIYGAWYGLGRAFIEGLRTDSLMLGNVRVSQALAAVLTLASLLVLLYVRNKIKTVNDPEYLKLYVHTEEGQAVLSGQFYRKRHPDEDGPKESTIFEGETVSEAEKAQSPENEIAEGADTADEEEPKDESKTD